MPPPTLPAPPPLPPEPAPAQVRPSRPARRALRTLLLPAVAAIAACTPAAGVRAEVVKPWTPAGGDSIAGIVAEARVRFRQVETDTIDEQSIVPFERVAQAARRLLRRLGRQNTLLAPGIEASLDSLGLDTDIVNDPQLPSIVFVLVRNPYRLNMQAVGYLLWYRGADLRMQGVAFPACMQPRIRSWWTGRPASPYATAIVYRERTESGRLGLDYLRLSPDGFYWDLVQYEGHGPDLGAHGEAAFADLDGDGTPELLSFSPAPPDSILRVELPVRPVLREAIFTDRGQGFIAHDGRIVPGPLATLRQFLSLLRDGDREQARRLLVDPDHLGLALAAGWAENRSPGNFVVDRQEQGQSWPEWLGARVRGATGVRRWVFHFALREGRWLIQDFFAEAAPRPETARGAPRDSTGGNRP